MPNIIVEDYQRFEAGCAVLLDEDLIQLGAFNPVNGKAAYHIYTLAHPYRPHVKVQMNFSNREMALEELMARKREFIPTYGYIPTDSKTVAYVSLMPLRQWMKYWHTSRCSIEIPNTAECKLNGLSNSDRNALPIILQKRTFMPVQEAIEKVNKGELLGAAIAPHYAIVAKLSSEYPRLLKRNKDLGSIQRNNLFVPRLPEYSTLGDLPKELEIRR